MFGMKALPTCVLFCLLTFMVEGDTETEIKEEPPGKGKYFTTMVLDKLFGAAFVLTEMMRI